MPTAVIMPALEMAQDSGKVLHWLRSPGDTVSKGEPIVEIETDKATVEIEAPASGTLREVTAREGDVVPVGQTIALILAPGEAGDGGRAPLTAPAAGGIAAGAGRPGSTTPAASSPTGGAAAPASKAPAIKASPLARRIAEQHGVDLAHVTTATGRIEKADVLAYVERQAQRAPQTPGPVPTRAGGHDHAGSGKEPAVTGAPAARLGPASPKARRLAAERGVEIATIEGTGPGGAILAADVLAVRLRPAEAAATPAAGAPHVVTPATAGVGTVWRIMAERMTASWTTAPHFYLVREVAVSRLVSWLDRARKETGARITYTDLLVKLVAAALARHPEVNASWKDGAVVRHPEVNVGLAVAIDAGLVVPVIHHAGALGLAELAARRDDLVRRAQAGKLRPADIQGGTFTISNLGMYGVDAFDAIVNPPQAAILAVGRIADRVVAVDGRPAVRPTTVLTLSCDHRALDGARGARFLGALADLIEEPLALLV